MIAAADPASDPVWSKISNALKKLGFRSHNFLAQLLSETSRACTGRGCKPRLSNPFDFFDHTGKLDGWQEMISSTDSVHRQPFRFGSLRTHGRRPATNLSAFETCNTTAPRELIAEIISQAAK
jgi:hypothetical protein